MPPLSILDLAFIAAGATPADALRNSLDLARHAESWGYRRFWVAEHHNMAGIASAATAVVVGYVAGGTRTIRVGAGGIMLPNHAPLVIAEQFGTLESLYPGRIDLGLGRAPGTDPQTVRALRRNPGSADTFPDDVLELQALLGPAQPGQVVHAIPGTGTKVPLWILGSSLYGAQLAAALGLPYAFASHFAPQALMPAIDVYRKSFKPSRDHERPRLMLGVNVIAADTDAEARLLATSLEQAFLSIRRGRRSTIPPPRADLVLQPEERAMLDEIFACSFIGEPKTVARDLKAFIERTQADEIIVASMIFDHQARLRSYELLAEELAE